MSPCLLHQSRSGRVQGGVVMELHQPAVNITNPMVPLPQWPEVSLCENPNPCDVHLVQCRPSAPMEQVCRIAERRDCGSS